MADQDEMNGLILSNLAKLSSRLCQVSGDLRAIRGLLEERRELGEFAQIIERLKQRGVITEDDVAKLEEVSHA